MHVDDGISLICIVQFLVFIIHHTVPVVGQGCCGWLCCWRPRPRVRQGTRAVRPAAMSASTATATTCASPPPAPRSRSERASERERPTGRERERERESERARETRSKGINEQRFVQECCEYCLNTTGCTAWTWNVNVSRTVLSTERLAYTTSSPCILGFIVILLRVWHTGQQVLLRQELVPVAREQWRHRVGRPGPASALAAAFLPLSQHDALVVRAHRQPAVPSDPGGESHFSAGTCSFFSGCLFERRKRGTDGDNVQASTKSYPPLHLSWLLPTPSVFLSFPPLAFFLFLFFSFLFFLSFFFFFLSFFACCCRRTLRACPGWASARTPLRQSAKVEPVAAPVKKSFTMPALASARRTT